MLLLLLLDKENMSLSVNGIIYEKNSLELINRIKQLPQPEIDTTEELICQNNEIGLCLQREALYIDQRLANNQISYLGSKNVVSCILLYLYSQSDHLIIHFDNTGNIDLTALLNNFKNLNQLQAILIGGIPNTISENTLNTIVAQLLKSSEQININITISYQKLIEDNLFEPDDNYQFLFDLLAEKTALVSMHFFNKLLNHKMVFKKALSDFQTRLASLPSSARLLIETLLSASEFYDLTDEKRINSLHNQFRQTFNETLFLEVLDSLFSIQGFALLTEIYERDNVYNRTKLTNFVFNINTKKIVIISPYYALPFEERRNLSLYTQPLRPYLMCYDDNFDCYTPPRLDDHFIKKCERIAPILQGKHFINKQLITASLGLNLKKDQIKFLFRFIKLLNAIQQRLSFGFLGQEKEVIPSKENIFQPHLK